MKYSKVYKHLNHEFRYNYDWGVVEYIAKADEWMLKEEAEWKASHGGRSLFDIDEEGYSLIDSVGLSKKNWEDKESRDSYLEEWIAEMRYEASLYAKEFKGVTQ